MKKLFFALVALMVISCGSKDDTTPQVTTSYAVKFEYSPAKEAQSQLTYDAKLKETLYMHEYNSNGNEIDSKSWIGPNVGQEKTFNANSSAVCVVIQCEVVGTARDGSVIAMSRYITNPLKLEKGGKVITSLTASTQMSTSNPMRK